MVMILMFVCDHCERKGSLRQYVFDWLGILQILRGGEVRISLINNQIRGTISMREVVVTITLKEVVIFIIVIIVLITSQAPALSGYIDYKKRYGSHNEQYQQILHMLGKSNLQGG